MRLFGRCRCKGRGGIKLDIKEMIWKGLSYYRDRRIFLTSYIFLFFI
jgi:hypothetical protein